MEASSPPTSSPGYHTAPQTQDQQASLSSSTTPHRNDSTTSPAKSPFPRANLTPITSLKVPSPPTPARASTLKQFEEMNVSSSSQLLPPTSSQPLSQAGPSSTQIRRTAAEIQKNKEAAQKKVRTVSHSTILVRSPVERTDYFFVLLASREATRETTRKG